MPKFYSVLRKNYLNEHGQRQDIQHADTGIMDEVGINLEGRLHETHEQHHDHDRAHKAEDPFEYKEAPVSFMKTGDG